MPQPCTTTRLFSGWSGLESLQATRWLLLIGQLIVAGYLARTVRKLPRRAQALTAREAEKSQARNAREAKQSQALLERLSIAYH